jgi:hypothetical protein
MAQQIFYIGRASHMDGPSCRSKVPHMGTLIYVFVTINFSVVHNTYIKIVI